jgi:hypothetical protein
LVDESLFAAANGRTKPGRAIPFGRKRVAYRKLVLGLVFLGLFIVLGGSCNYAVALTPWFASKGLVYRCVFASHVFLFGISADSICGVGLRSIKFVDSWRGASIMLSGR